MIDLTTRAREDERETDWSALRQQIEAALYDEAGKCVVDFISGLVDFTPELEAKWRRAQRAHRRSQRSTAGQTRRRKHGRRR